MRKQLILCVALLSGILWGISNPHVSAQRVRGFRGLVGQVEAGWSWVDHAALNDVLTRPDSGYLPFDNAFFSLGFGLERINRRLIYGGNVYAFMVNAPGQQQALFRLAILNYYYATLKFGYIFFQSDNPVQPAFIYPTIGVGGGTSFFRASPSGFSAFDKYYGPGLLVDAALHLSYMAEIPGSNYHVKFGISLGYMLNPGVGWELGEYVNDAASVITSPQGPYFRVNFGMGGIR